MFKTNEKMNEKFWTAKLTLIYGYSYCDSKDINRYHIYIIIDSTLDLLVYFAFQYLMWFLRHLRVQNSLLPKDFHKYYSLLEK